ncbi:MAG TPA: hypothetical protein VHN98_11960 [Acidimicrobiales bacterium]|nr:hypothetical protein [Acidimicrobiales bacterium]
MTDTAASDSTVSDPPDDTAGPPEARPAHPARPQRWVLITIAVLGLLCLALAGLAVQARTSAADQTRERKEIQRVSSDVATGLLTYDYRNLDTSKKRVESNATGKFRKEYESAFASGLGELLNSTKATSQGTVRDVFVSDIADNAASAIVVANAVADGTAGRRASVDSYIQLDLVKVGGKWRVDGVTNLNFGQTANAGAAGGAGAAPPAAPTTTAKPSK